MVCSYGVCIVEVCSVVCSYGVCNVEVCSVWLQICNV